MNHIYKTVWNAGLQAWVAVGELTKAHGKTKSSRAASSQNGASAKRRRSTALMLAAGLSTIALPVLADTWNNTGIGDWAVDGNWADGSAPTSSDSAIIDNGGTAQVTTPGAQSSPVTVGESGAGALDILTGGTLLSSSPGVIGKNTGSTGIVTVDGSGSSWTNSSSLAVGLSGDGTLTISNGGAVSNANNGIIGSAGGSTGTVTVDGSGSSWTISNSLFVGGTGAGTLTIRNGGSVSANGNGGVIVGFNTSSSTGTLNIGAAFGNVAAAAGTLNASTLSFGTGTGTLVFNHTDTAYNFSPAITGTGAIGLYSGTTRFAGDLSAYAGTMTVDGGTLALTAGQTLSFLGDYVQSANGTLRVDVTNDTTYGKLFADTAILPSNAKINVNVADANFNFTATSLADIIATDGVLTSGGTFDVTDNSVLFNFGAVLDGNTVDLTLTAAGGGGGGGGGSSGLIEDIVVAQGNNPATGAARVLDNLIDDFIAGSTGDTDMDTVIGALGRLSTSREVSDAVAETLPLMTASMTQVATNVLHSTNRVIQARQESNIGLSSGDDFLGDKKLWLKPVGSWTRQDNRKGVSGYDANTYGFVAGADGEINDATRIGVALSYMNSNVDGKSTASGNSADIDAYQAIVYGSRSLSSDTELNWQADVGLNKNEGRRRIDFGGLNRVAKADYDSLTAHIGLGLARSYQLNDRTTVTPVVRADYTYIRDESYTEKGADALNLKVKGHSADELILMAEGRLSHQFTDKATFVANAGIGYDVLNDESSLTSSYVGGGAAFATRGLDASPWLGRAGLGLSVNATETTEITARYDLEARSDYLDQTASIKVRWAF